MFHNIFKREAKKKDSQISKITIDDREKNSLVPSDLAKLQVPIEFQHLKVGDYIVNDIVIERKTLSDLKSSIINKRIFSQIQEIKQYPKYILLVEGPEQEKYNNEIIHGNALRGFLLSISLEKIPIIFTENERDTAFYLSLLAKRKDNKSISLRPGKISFSRAEQLQYILEGFPNIGPVKSKALIKKFESLKNIVSASEQELEEILGKKVKEFKSLLD
jgi:Fanconi anemia group M protein